MKYFENFPIIEYDGKKVRDITRRNTLMRNIQTNPLVFLPYTVREGEKAEDIANFYYGSTDYTWLVYLSNNIVDPYHQWPKSELELQDYIIDKYAEESGRKGTDVIDWAQEENEANVVYYYRDV
jgi:hypothetical protein